jgi:hypothetical protein
MCRRCDDGARLVRRVVPDTLGGVLDVRGIVLDVSEAFTCLGFVGARD